MYAHAYVLYYLYADLVLIFDIYLLTAPNKTYLSVHFYKIASKSCVYRIGNQINFPRPNILADWNCSNNQLLLSRCNT